MIQKLVKHYLASFAGLPVAAWLLALVIFINRCGSMVIFFMSLYFTQELGFSIETTGILIGVFGAGSLIGSYIGGWLSDRFGTAVVQWTSLFFGGIFYLVLGYLRSVESIAVALFFLSVIAEAFRPANVTAFTEICSPKIQARGFALMRLAANLGITFGPALGGVLAMRNYHLLFWVDGLTCIVAAILFGSFVGKLNLSTMNDKKNRSESAVVSPWHDPLYLAFLGLILVIGTVFFQVFNTWPLYLRQECLFAENRIGLLMGINAALVVLIEMPIVHALEKKNPTSTILTGMAFLFAGFAILPLSKAYAFVIFSVILWTMGEILIFPMAATWISLRAPRSSVGTYMGLYALTFSSSMMISPMVCSWIYKQFGSIWLWLASGLAGVLVVAGMAFIRPAMRRSAELSG